MSYWSAAPPLLWQDETLDLFGTEEFRVVDGGAAGTLFEPFSNLSETCTIYTFEVRGKDAIEQTGNLNVDAGL